ncbi:hypothetical protein CR513_38347, partial [Mucuna pruriens]
MSSGGYPRLNSLAITYIGSIRTSLLVRLILTLMKGPSRDLFKADWTLLSKLIYISFILCYVLFNTTKEKRQRIFSQRISTPMFCPVGAISFCSKRWLRKG